MIHSVHSDLSAPAVGGTTGVTANGGEEEVKKSKAVPKEEANNDVEAEDTRVESQESANIKESDGQTGETEFAKVESDEDVTQTEPAETGYDASSTPTGTENDTIGSVVDLVA